MGKSGSFSPKTTWPSGTLSLREARLGSVPKNNPGKSKKPKIKGFKSSKLVSLGNLMKGISY